MAKKTRPRKQAPPARLQGYRPLLEKLIFVFALLGVLTTVHLWIQESRGFDQGCWGFNPPGAAASAFNCEAVVESAAGTFLGVSNVVLGLLFYVTVAALSAAVAFTSGTAMLQLKRLRAVLLTAGLLYSAYLVYYQYVEIGEFCALCLTSAAIAAVLFALQAVDFFKPVDRVRLSMQSRTTMREAGTFAALAVLALLLVGADVAYFSSLEKPTVARPDAAQPYAAAATGTEGEVLECTYDPEKSPLSNYNELISFADPMKGDPGAAVTVIEIFEPNCPHCKDLHPIMENVIAAHGDKARFYVKPVVFWPDRSLVQAEALYAAAQEGKFFEMLDRQFELQQPRTGLSLEQIQGIAREIGMNPEALTTRLQRGMYRNVVQRQYEKIVGEMGIRSVPAVLIDGRFVDAGSRNVACLGQLIEAAAGR